MHSHQPSRIGLVTLTLLIIISIDSIRNLPAVAIFGEPLIFFFLFGALTFLLPTALLSAELSSTWTEEGGIYYWVKKAFGDHVGTVAIWLQWINTVVWIPTILSFITSTLAYLIKPDLANNPYYLIPTILVLLWIMTGVNLLGIRISARIASFCAVLGVFIPMFALIILGGLWLYWGKPVHLHLSFQNAIPSFSHMDNWLSLTAVMTAFLGTELATVNIRDVESPRKTFPRALMLATTIILFTMVLGSLTIALMLPVDKINLMNGTMQALSELFNDYHLSYLLPIAVIMMLAGALGEMINWTTSPARGLTQTIDNGYLPKWLKSKRPLIPYSRVLIVQSVIASILSSLFILLPKVNSSYWLLTDLSTEVYMLMYVLMFAAGLRLVYKFPQAPMDFHFLSKKLGRWIICVLGFIGCAITLAVGFIPPSNTTISFGNFSLMFIGGLILMILPVFGLFAYHRWGGK